METVSFQKRKQQEKAEKQEHGNLWQGPGRGDGREWRDEVRKAGCSWTRKVEPYS
jgi:hypothetical protein